MLNALPLYLLNSDGTEISRRVPAFLDKMAPEATFWKTLVRPSPITSHASATLHHSRSQNGISTHENSPRRPARKATASKSLAPPVEAVRCEDLTAFLSRTLT